MLRKVLIEIMMVLLPSMALAQGAGGQVRRSVKKQEATTTSTKKRQKQKRESEQKPDVQQSEQQHVVQQSTEVAGYDVTITCNVPSATMYIDDIPSGNAQGIRFLKSGKHHIRVLCNGYNEFVQTINVGPQSNSFQILLSEVLGYDITITCNVPNSALYVDDIAMGTVGNSIRLTTGIHKIMLKSEGYEPLISSINVNSSSTYFSFVMNKTKVNYTQTTNDGITLTTRDFGLASISKDIRSATINGQIYHYTRVDGKQDLAVIVAKKKAYKEFKEVVLPETFTDAEGMTLTIVGIGDKAFEKCKSIKKVDLPKTVRIIGNEAFCNADVDDLTLREGLIRIGNNAFFNNDLKDIHIPDGVEEIGELAFFCFKSTIFQRSGSGTLYIPKSVCSIGDKAFAMTRNGYGAWFNSKRKILCLPDHVNLDNCKKMGISKEPVEDYLKGVK